MSDRLRQPVSDDVYEDLLISIVHQIVGTLDKTERACLTGDKVMFAVGRQFGLSEGKLAGLTLEQVCVLAPDVARTSAPARAWAEWYWAKMRPELQPMADVDCVFALSRTRHGFQHSAVGLRFQRMLKTARCRLIVSYGMWINRI